MTSCTVIRRVQSRVLHLRKSRAWMIHQKAKRANTVKKVVTTLIMIQLIMLGIAVGAMQSSSEFYAGYYEPDDASLVSAHSVRCSVCGVVSPMLISELRGESVGTITFVRGEVSNQFGQLLSAGSTLTAAERIQVASDGFISFEHKDGRVLNIQPDTETSIADELDRKSGYFRVTGPFLSAAIRG